MGSGFLPKAEYKNFRRNKNEVQNLRAGAASVDRRD